MALPTGFAIRTDTLHNNMILAMKRFQNIIGLHDRQMKVPMIKKARTAAENFTSQLILFLRPIINCQRDILIFWIAY